MGWCANGFGWSGFGSGGALLGGLMMLLFWGALIALAFIGIRALLRSNQGRWGVGGALSATHSSRAMETVQLRYASGEITRAEYEELRRELSS